MAQTQKEIKARYFKKKYENAPWIACACGCGSMTKATDEYGRSRRFIVGHNARKYDDPTQYRREWRSRNKAKVYGYKKARWRMLKIRLIHEFGHDRCQKNCGVTYNGTNAAVFHFHHLDSSTKSFALGNQLTSRSWAQITAEAAKCEMICANCHELEHGEPF